jgi:hypothetical protein
MKLAVFSAKSYHRSYLDRVREGNFNIEGMRPNSLVTEGHVLVCADTASVRL